MRALKDMTAKAMESFKDKQTQLCVVPEHGIDDIFIVMDHYPMIHLNCDTLNGSMTRSPDSLRNVMIPTNEGILKRVLRTICEARPSDALHEARDPMTARTNPLISHVAVYTFHGWDYLKDLAYRVCPFLRDNGVNKIAKHSETRDWINSCVRCIAWHPKVFKIAVAGSDDAIRIFTDKPSSFPVVKSSLQRHITVMAWRPHASGQLAVGCERGVCLWTLENIMNITRPSSQAIVLRHRNHYPVTSLEWNSIGTLLATASIGDSDVLLWNVDRMNSYPLKRVGPSCSILKWAPGGLYLFTGTVGTMFRVWNARMMWKPERWTLKSGNIQSACWSPCGGCLVFITSDDKFLFSLQFQEERLFRNKNDDDECIANNSEPIANLSKVTCPDSREVGGQPQSLAWDPKGRFLAVTFKDTSCVAIFVTFVRKFYLDIAPLFHLTGIENEHPSFICFQNTQQQQRNSDSILTIAWSSGRIQYFPFADADAD